MLLFMIGPTTHSGTNTMMGIIVGPFIVGDHSNDYQYLKL